MARFRTRSGTWLDDVNAEGGTGFAGCSDWRIPNAKELQSIVDFERFDPSIDPVFHTGCEVGCSVLTCSCTVSLHYYSSTSYVNGSTVAYAVGFVNGILDQDAKTFLRAVRAVRGGL